VSASAIRVAAWAEVQERRLLEEDDLHVVEATMAAFAAGVVFGPIWLSTLTAVSTSAVSAALSTGRSAA
jgi:hypothetical protein